MIGSTPATDIHNAQVLDAVPVGVRKVLEVGTGTGALAREIRKKCPGVDYVGVEISAEYRDAAQAWCDRAYLENFEQASETLMQELANADVVIFADVLEHFIDPWASLKRMRAVLPAHARIIASIPNIQHWSIQVRLLSGDFRYADVGLLDRTHLRFFTRQTMLEMFASTGYRVEAVVPRIFAFPQQDEMLQKIAQISQLHGVDPNMAVQDAAAFQYVMTAVPAVA